MSEDFGNGVSRTLSALQRQFQNVVFQKGKPPLDSEFNLVSQASGEALRQFVSSQVHSGFFLDPTLALEDFVTDPLNSNQFFLGTQKNDDNGNVEELDPVVFANVNGWIIPITGTVINQQGATTNQVRLNPPPESDNRIDFVFLEAWQVLVSANPSTDNKPSASTIWKYGNTEYGGVNITDDLVDPTIGFPTTRRVQLQYRIRVVGSGNGAGSSPDLSIYPDGLGDPNITAQGPNDSASAFVYENMRKALGDASLWRAGDGDPDNALGTVDGYVYAIPICAVFRRNSLPFVAATLSGNPNQNGAFNRNPSAILLTNPLEGAKKLTQMSLINALPAQQFTVDTVVQVDFGQGSGFDDPSMDLNKTFMVIDNEVIAIKSINTAVSPNQVVVPAGGRGRWGSDIVTHGGRTDPTVAGTGSKINFFNTRPDGKFADEIAQDDILDLRRGINVGDWDYERLLLHNIAMLIRGRLRSTWKQAGVPGGDTEGVDVIEVDYLLQDGATAVPNGTEAVDGPDGIRQVWSDAAAIQGDVTVLCDNDGTISSGFVQTLDDLVEWDVGADFKPSGFINNLGSNGYTNGTTIFLHIGGDDGNQGARKTFRANGTRAVRFVSPKEYFKRILPETDTGLQTPVSLLWTSTDQANAGVQAPGAGLQALIPASAGESQTEHPGPMYPLAAQNFEYPYLVTGGVVNNALVVTGINGATQLIGNSLNPTIPLGEGEIVLPGLNFDAVGDWYSLNAQGLFANNPGVLNFPLLRGQRTLFDMITNGGRDRTGNSSELYLILFGDDETTANNGVWKVIGAGTATDASGSGLTTNPASASDRVRVKFMTVDPSAVAAPFIYQDFDNTTTKTLTAQIRSQITNAEDGPGAAVGPASLCVTLTDISAKLGGASNPWSETNINPSSLPGFTLEQPFNEKLVINLTLLYHPGRGATQRVATRMDRVAMQSAPSKVLRQSKAVLDPTFPTATGAPSNPAETQFDPVHVQTWNRLPSLGLPAPQAPNYGGNVVLFSEIDRENEVFFDNGSKTLVLRPVQRQSMTIQGITVTPPTVGATLLGVPTLDNPSAGTTYPNPALIPSGWDGPKDDAQIFTTGLRGGYAVPQQYMPRFGRQDIPYYQDNGPAFGTGQFLEGINHLFLDTTDVTNPVFNIIGGQDNLSGGNLVTRFLLQTGTTSGLDYAQYGTITGTTSQAYQARLTTEIDNCCSGGEEIAEYLANVTSSDFGTGLRGIQLPPYLGIVRLYGVYDRRDFVAKGGVTYQANRVTPEANRATNLLRRDATKQTLFICKDGAIDLTGEADDHTYIIPENVLDLTKSPFYAGEDFSEMEYVVEFTCFGFSKGFINKNNFVMARRHNGQGALITDGDNPELEGVLMCIPSAAPDSSRVYVSSTRTVYQGDPYFSRAGTTRTLSDYETRYGQISQSDAFELSKRIQQFDANGNQIPEIPNARKFQVLAALDFYTTLGSGNIGGRLYPGTPLDVGFTQNTPDAATRIPASVTTPAWRVLTRAFTEGQQKNSSRASAILEIIGTNATFDFVTPSTFSVQTLSGALVQFRAVNGPTLNPDEFDASSPDPTVIARELFEKINARADLSDTLIAFNDIDSTQIELVSRVVGAEGNEIIVSINDEENFLLNVARSGDEGFNSLITSTNLRGGEDIVANGGNGTTQLELTGMTERLPLGILLQDSDFIGENPLNDNTSAFQTLLGGIRPSQILLPLTRSGGEEYTRFTGAPGELIAQGDGAILAYGAYNATTNPTGSKRFRLFRGGGSLFVLNGRNPGGPIDWVSDTLEPALKPVLKGGLLACKALLVRNYVENAFSDDAVTTDGDEIQLIIISQGILGDGTTQNRGLDLNGIISPTGFGEGMAASDRYRIAGKPMYQGRVRTAPNPDDILLAVFPGRNAF